MLRILAMTKGDENAFVETGIPDGPEDHLQGICKGETIFRKNIR